MALRDMTLSVIISAKDRLSAPLRNLSGNLEGVEARLRASSGRVADFNRKWEQTINLARGVGAAITVASGAMLAGTGYMIQAATDLGEAINKVDVIFKGNGAALEAWAQDSATRLGLSKRAALEAAGSFGVLFDALDPSEAARMSESLVQLSADIASINNIDPEEALLRLRAGLVGETEPLRRVGILLNAVEVEAKAVAMGLSDGNGVVSEAAKVQARYALIMEKSAVQQGDFARTSDQAANQQRILRAEMENAAAAAGGALKQGYESALAALLPLVDAATKFIETPLGQEAVRIAAGMALVGTAIGPLLYTLPTIIAHWTAISGAATAAWAAMTGPVGLVVAGVAAVGYAIYEVATATERASAAGNALWESFNVGAEAAARRVDEVRERLEGVTRAQQEAQREANEAEQKRADKNQEILEEEARLRSEISEAVLDYQEAIARNGRQSEQTMLAELRLLERRRELLAFQIEQAETLNMAPSPETQREIGVEIDPNARGMERARQYDEVMAALQRQFAATDTAAERLRTALGPIASEMAAATPPTRELTKDEQALAAATKRAADAATDYGKAQRDAGRDMEDAREAITEAEQAIADASEDRAERIAEANQRVADAQADLARAVEDAAERVEDAQERAARSVESAEERISDIRERIAELDAPELTPEQRKQKRRLELLEELGEAEEELARTKARTQEDVRKAEEDAARTVEQATRRVQEAEKARGDAIEQAEERVRAAYKRREDAVEALALAEERANERIAAAIDKVTEANNKLAKAQEKVNGTRPSGVQQGPGTPAGGAGAVAAPIPIQPVYVMPPAGAQPRFAPTPTPQVAMRSAGGGELHVYLHSDPGFVLDTAKQRAGEIIGSVNGVPAVVHIVRDMFARR